MAIKMGLRQANQEFSKAMKAVRAGKEVVLTERGEAIAIIRPLPRGPDLEAVIERLRVSGFLRAAPESGSMAKWKPKPIRGQPVASTIHEERNER